MKKNIPPLLVAVIGLCVLVACNTVKGIGKDVQKVGEKVEQSSGK